MDLTGAPSAVQCGFEDDKRSIGAGAASPDSLGIALVQVTDIRFFGASFRPQRSRRVCEIAKPILYLGRRQRGALYGTKRGHDVGINAVARGRPPFCDAPPAKQHTR